MNTPASSFHVTVDPTNPGQFFACCGLLELADRLWPGAEGWFDGSGSGGGGGGGGVFHIAAADGSLSDLLRHIIAAPLCQLDLNDDLSSPLEIGTPFRLRLDWWVDEKFGGKALKVWAGRMGSARIARAMRNALGDVLPQPARLLDWGAVVPDPDNPAKKVEPYYFDARRGTNAMALDIGFSPDALAMTTTAYPAVEFLCLVGLQRGRPLPTATPRMFEYATWSVALGIAVMPAAIGGLLAGVGAHGFRFENAYRTDQKKHKAFLPAVSIGAIS